MSSSDTVIRCVDVSKKFCKDLRRSLWYGVKDIVSEVLLTPRKSSELRKDEFWALQDISFELRRGETLGLIGHNGAGKSTLLKLINGLIKPDRGTIEINGRMGALIELGAGFNPILTGRENIYINAAVLGLTKKEIDRQIGDIIDFAELGDFIEAPVQSYSSGMKVRLGFAVASNLQPDILLIDEVLSVGDASFRQRCLDRLNDYSNNGGSIIFVSHNTLAVEAVSDKAILLDHGKIAKTGMPPDVISFYEKIAMKQSDEYYIRTSSSQLIEADEVKVIEVEVHDKEGIQQIEIPYREPFTIFFKYESPFNIDNPNFTVSLRKGSSGNPLVCSANSSWDVISFKNIPSSGIVKCSFTNPNLTPGKYYVNIGIQKSLSSQLGSKWYSRPRDHCFFIINPTGLREKLPGAPALFLSSKMPPVMLDHSWEIK